MKSVNGDWLKFQEVILSRMREEGVIRDLPLREKYHVETAFKFGGKKRKGSNSGGCGRAGRRHARHGRRLS